MKRFLIRHVDRILVVLGLSLLIVLSVRTLDNLANLVAVEAPQELRLDGGDLTALYALNSGMNKPAILNRYGDALLEFSGWNSHITVDGVTADLWSHAFNTELDRERTRAFLTWSSSPLREGDPRGRRVRRYRIEQVVSLEGTQATVEYYIIPNEPFREVQLTLGLYKWYFRDLEHSGSVLSFSGTDLNRQQAEQRLEPRRVTPVVVRLLTSKVGDRVLSNEHGTYAVEVSFAGESPKVYERTLLARLNLSLRLRQ